MKHILIICVLAILVSACGVKKEARTSMPMGFSRTGEVLTGKASWYGGYFHGRKTASGERFNTHELTAAHKTLPFGTYLEVVNTNNQKAVVVKVNDRGPFIRGRILDLSHEAAKKLEYLDSGSTHVVAEVLRPK